jgi:hypothetical protein
MRRPRNRVVGFLLLLVGALVLAACGGSAEETTTTLTSETVAPGEPQTPSELTPGSEFTFEMPADSNLARFAFDVEGGSVVTLDATGAADNSSAMSLSFGPTGQSAYRTDVAPGEVIDAFQYVTSVDGGGSWALEIQANAGDEVTLTVETPLQADGGGTGDAGSNAADPTSIELGAELAGLLGDEDTEDWYVIPLEGGDIVTVTVDVPPADGSGSIFGDLVYNGNQVASFSVDEGGEEVMQRIFAQDQTGEAYLRVSGVGDYGFTVDAGPQMDGGTEGDAGGDLGSAKEADFGEIGGILGGDDAQDYYVLTLPKDAVLSGTFASDVDAVGELRIELVYNGAKFATISLNPGQTEDLTFAQVNAEGDSLFLRVASTGGEYAMNLDAATQPDGGDGVGDAPDDAALAKEVEPDGTFDGILNNTGSIDPRDNYQFTAKETGTLPIEVSVDAEVGADVRIQIRYDGNKKVADFTVGQGGSTMESIDVVEGTTYVMEFVTPAQALYTVTFG